MDQSSTSIARASAAFNIGHDAGMYGLTFMDDWPIELRQGFAEARKHYPKPKASDRFIRKWIQLRVGAFRRDKSFSEQVTPGYLTAIDLPLCPVSYVTLTHRDGSDTDWSIDRVDNTKGYEQRNLMVLCTLKPGPRKRLQKVCEGFSDHCHSFLEIEHVESWARSETAKKLKHT